jgi:hypothetical protein
MSVVSALFQAMRGRLHRPPRPKVSKTSRLPLSVAPIPEDPEELADPGCELRIERMMRAFHVNRHELEEDYTRILLDAEMTCLRCRAKRRCLRELQAGTAVANAEHFCPNADILFVFANDRDLPAAFRR